MDNLPDKLPDWQDCVWRRVGCQSQDCPICGDFELWLQKKREQNKDSIYGIKTGIWQDDEDNFDLSQENYFDEEEPEEPEPHDFDLYNNIYAWYRNFIGIIEESQKNGEVWEESEDGQNLS